MKQLFFLIGLLLPAFLFSQTASDFFKKGDSLYEAKDYKNSALAYTAGIRGKGNEALLSRYTFCAALWSLAGASDSAFHYLDFISKSDKVSLTFV